MKKLSLRPYQEDSINAIIASAKKRENALAVLPTGAGKSIICAEINRQVINKINPRARILMVVDSGSLVQQNYEKLRMLDSSLDMGLYCAGLRKKELGHQITYATVQSIHKCDANAIGWIDAILIDECHMIPDEGDGMYLGLISKLKMLNPKMVVIGLTATPYRSSTGLITDSKNGLFTDICYNITMKELMEMGYLSPLVSKVSRQELDLSGVRVGADGDYMDKDLDILLSNEERVSKTIDEVETLASDRNSFLYFCSSVKHCYLVEEELKKRNISCAVITGAHKQKDREPIIQDYRTRKIKALVSCEVFLKGFDAPCTDCLVCLSPTKSTGRFVQLCGRGTRLCPELGKTNCLVLDFANLIQEHGAVDKIKIRKKKNRTLNEGKVECVREINSTKLCIDCRGVIDKSAKVCPHCGYEYSIEEMIKHSYVASELNIMSTEEKSEWLNIKSTSYKKWKKSKVDRRTCATYDSYSLRTRYNTEDGDQINMFMSFDKRNAFLKKQTLEFVKRLLFKDCSHVHLYNRDLVKSIVFSDEFNSSLKEHLFNDLYGGKESCKDKFLIEFDKYFKNKNPKITIDNYGLDNIIMLSKAFRSPERILVRRNEDNRKYFDVIGYEVYFITKSDDGGYDFNTGCLKNDLNSQGRQFVNTGNGTYFELKEDFFFSKKEAIEEYKKLCGVE